MVSAWRHILIFDLCISLVISYSRPPPVLKVSITFSNSFIFRRT